MVRWWDDMVEMRYVRDDINKGNLISTIQQTNHPTIISSQIISNQNLLDIAYQHLNYSLTKLKN